VNAPNPLRAVRGLGVSGPAANRWQQGLGIEGEKERLKERERERERERESRATSTEPTPMSTHARGLHEVDIAIGDGEAEDKLAFCVVVDGHGKAVLQACHCVTR
jgi:hypothetical protein